MLKAAAPTTMGARAPIAAPATIAGAPTPTPAGAKTGVSVEDAEPAAREADQEGAAMGVGTQVGTVVAMVAVARLGAAATVAATEAERAGLVVLMGGHRGCLALSSSESARHFSPSSRIHGVRAFLGPSLLFFFRGFCTARVLMSGAMLELSCAVNGTDSPASDVATLIWAEAEEQNS